MRYFCSTTIVLTVAVTPDSISTTIIRVPRRRFAPARALLDPADAAVRRRFIRAFMNDDVVRARDVGYNPATLIDADRELRDYFAWLAGLNGTGHTS